jgi:hypothetical protein
MILVGLAGWQMAHFTLDAGPVQLLAAQAIQGMGLAFMFVSLTTAALDSNRIYQKIGCRAVCNVDEFKFG